MSAAVQGGPCSIWNGAVSIAWWNSILRKRSSGKLAPFWNESDSSRAGAETIPFGKETFDALSVNTDAVGAIVRQALQLVPTVRGIHFQPVSYFGRFPERDGAQERFTLPELMRCLEEQTGGLLKLADFSPPGGEHAHCSFHATYLYSTGGELRPLGGTDSDTCCTADCGSGAIRRTVDSVSRRWRLPSPAAFSNSPPISEQPVCCSESSPDAVRVEGSLDLDVFLQEIATRSFTLSAMAFQDADNLDLERLRGCCISVVSPDGRLVPFCAYNITSREGRSLYREAVKRERGQNIR